MACTGWARHEDATHGFRRRPKKVGAVLPGLILGANQPQPRLMDQRGGLKRVIGRFVRHLLSREFAELVINERQEFFSGLDVFLMSALEDTREVAFL